MIWQALAIVLCIKYHDKFYLTEKKDIFLMHLLVIRMTGKQKVLYISMIEFLQDLQICPIVRFIKWRLLLLAIISSEPKKKKTSIVT